MREVPYDRERENRPYHRNREWMDDFVGRRSRRDEWDERRPIGYRTYNSYRDRERLNESDYDDRERMMLMDSMGLNPKMSRGYNDYNHFTKRSAKDVVDNMYHVKDGTKYVGEQFDMRKAQEVCEKYRNKLDDEVEVADVYVAINGQYHDYCELFEKWFGQGNIDDMIIESAICFWFDDDDFGEDKVWKYFNELD